MPAKEFVTRWLLFLDLVEQEPQQLVDLIEQRRSQMEKAGSADELAMCEALWPQQHGQQLCFGCQAIGLAWIPSQGSVFALVIATSCHSAEH